MAQPAILPNPFAWYSNSKNRYLRDGPGGILQFTGQDPTPLFTTENGHIPGYVHIKYNVNGKYLVRRPGQISQPFQIVATADTRNENTTVENCTLFQPEKFELSTSTQGASIQVVFRLLHVQSNLYIRPDHVADLDGVPCASGSAADGFTAVLSV